MRIYGLGTEGGGLLSGICGTVGGAFPGSHGKGSGSQPAHGHEIVKALGFGGFREFKYAVLKAASGRGSTEADAKADSRAVNQIRTTIIRPVSSPPRFPRKRARPSRMPGLLQPR
mgnify:CR=1 FL=1